MVATSAQYNFTSVIEEFLALKPMAGPHGDVLRQQVRERAQALFSHPDVRYMPAFKLLDLLAEMVNLATAISDEAQLRRTEATALLNSHISDHAPLIIDFLLEAAVERARYAPMMLEPTSADGLAYRNLLLQKRWEAMLTAHQQLVPLPMPWVQSVSAVVTSAIQAQTFAHYRIGPLLQLFAEMLSQARQLHETSAPVEQLEKLIGPQSALWKRYILKAARYREREDSTAHAGALPAQARMPGVTLPAKHSLH
jgi:hypothetical protein